MSRLLARIFGVTSPIETIGRTERIMDLQAKREDALNVFIVARAELLSANDDIVEELGSINLELIELNRLSKILTEQSELNAETVKKINGLIN
jgi:hypothetical protein